MFPLLIKPVSDRCDLDCRGCFYKDRPGKPAGLPARMSIKTFARLVRLYASVAPFDGAYVWQGGEPTLWPIENYRAAMELQAAHHREEVQNIIQTHGLNLTEEWVEFLAEHGFAAGISYDGPHGMGRHWDPDIESFLSGAAGMLESYGVGYSVVCTVDASIAMNPKGTVRAMREIGDSVQFIPRRRVSLEGERGLIPSGEAYACFLQVARYEMDYFGMTLVNDLSAADAWESVASCCEIAETCGNTVVVESDGSLYPCDFHVFEPYCAGNIHDIVDLAEWYETNPTLLEFRQLKGRSHPECEECQSRPACNRGCPRDRYLEEGNYSDKTRWCEALRQCAEETRPITPLHLIRP